MGSGISRLRRNRRIGVINEPNERNDILVGNPPTRSSAITGNIIQPRANDPVSSGQRRINDDNQSALTSNVMTSDHISMRPSQRNMSNRSHTSYRSSPVNPTNRTSSVERNDNERFQEVNDNDDRRGYETPRLSLQNAASSDMFHVTAMSLGMENDDLLFNLLYFGGGENINFGTMINSAMEETVALYSENNCPYKLCPASNEQLSGLPTYILSNNSSLKEIECAVCKDDIEIGNEITLLPECNHYFHSECVSRWLKMQAWCPVCRANITTKLKEEPQGYDDALTAMMMSNGSSSPIFHVDADADDNIENMSSRMFDKASNHGMPSYCAESKLIDSDDDHIEESMDCEYLRSFNDKASDHHSHCRSVNEDSASPNKKRVEKSESKSIIINDDDINDLNLKIPINRSLFHDEQKLAENFAHNTITTALKKYDHESKLSYSFDDKIEHDYYDDNVVMQETE